MRLPRSSGAWFFGVVVAVVAACVPAAIADAPDAVRQQLVDASAAPNPQLSPVPLYPAHYPPRLRRSNASLSLDGSDFTVTLDRGSKRGSRVGYVLFGRSSFDSLNDDLRVVRKRGFKPQAVKVGKRPVWYLCGHICGYVWHEQGLTYSVSGTYYLERTQSRLLSDMRALIKKLKRVA
jgi:hypothetical protein